MNIVIEIGTIATGGNTMSLDQAGILQVEKNGLLLNLMFLKLRQIILNKLILGYITITPVAIIMTFL